MNNLIALLLTILPLLPSSAVEAPIACNLGVLTAAERKHHDELGREIFSSVERRQRTSDGYSFRLEKRVSFRDLTDWVALEQRCCPFFDFRIDVACETGALTLTLGGRPGVREFIESELRSRDSSR